MQHERGAMTLFVAAIILPLLFLFCTFTLDLQKYFREQSRAQHAIDEAAQYAYRFLPDVARAEAAAKLYLKVNAPSIAPYASVSASASGMSIRVEAASKLSFASAFTSSLPEGERQSLLGLPLRVHNEVRGTPLDTIIAMDASWYLAPALDAGAAWGTDAGWPATTLFSGTSPQVSVVDQEKHPVDNRVATQQCFNPAFSSIKHLAIALYETLSASEHNSVGVVVFPGGGLGSDTLLAPQARVRGEQVSARWIPSAAQDYGVSNDLCLSASYYEASNPSYLLPQFNPAQGAAGWSVGSVAQAAVLPGAWIYNPTYSTLSLPEALWAQAVRPRAWEPDSEKVLTSVVESLAGAPALGARGALRGRAVGVGLIISGDLPRVAGERFPASSVRNALRRRVAQLAALVADQDARPGLQERIYYVLLTQHEGVTPAPSGSEVAALSEFLKSVSSEKLQIKLVAAASAALLGQKGVEALMAEQKTPVITR